MKIIHRLGKRAEQKEGEGSFLLTDRKGTYLSLGSPQNITHMQGLFHLDKHWSMYKSVENISIEKETTELENNFSHVIRRSGESEETFHLSSTALIYEVKNYIGKINLALDFRPIFDFDDHDRIYSVNKEGDTIIIQYAKHNKYLAIKGADEFEQTGAWERREYSYDKTRNSRCEFYTYKALSILCKNDIKLFISFSDSRDDAIRNVAGASRNESLLKEALRINARNICKKNDFAVNAALYSLDSLRTLVGKGDHKLEGVFAGLPWFFQFWSRDEMISLKAFMLQGKFEFAKKRIIAYLHVIDDSGRIPNRMPTSSVGSADGIFWLFKRIHDLLLMLDEKKLLRKYFSDDELNFIKHKLHFSMEEHMVRFMKKSMIINSFKETWMDTTLDGEDGRVGFCIEIQALFLSTFQLMRFLCSKLKLSYHSYSALEKMLAKNVREHFFRDGILIDRIGDSAARPNVFIAYYAYPDLLSSFEWKMMFDKVLTKLWLDWGGLSTIAKDSPMFHKNYSGENNKSYHHGDSWFWINNLAAVCMASLDKKRYEYFIEHIFHASRNDLLFSGFIGHASELSSAERQRAEGCLSQAWSSAIFLELADKLKLL